MSENAGNLRYDIWDYIVKTYGIEQGTVDYSDFKQSIRILTEEKQLQIDENDLISVETETFEDICSSMKEPDVEDEIFDDVDQSAVSNLSIKEKEEFKLRYLFKLFEAQQELSMNRPNRHKRRYHSKQDVWDILLEFDKQGELDYDEF